eukprot:GEZU01038935.1.p1 GENE.GEZU01038935.1~~GEZU01038935.1.p1  ORF type:complete len:368 (-),score=203.75 GEZU01038935.1:94-1197(-)
MADKQQQIREQVEFYFSDSNFPKDKFLRSTSAMHPEGYVSIELINSFKRMRQIGATPEDVVKALEGSKIVQVSEDGKMVRRLEPIPEKDESVPRSIVAKNFFTWTDEAEREAFKALDIDELKQPFAQFGKILAVRKRRTKGDFPFKPSIFVEFSTEEEAQKAAAAEKVTFKGREIPILLKSKYFEQKAAEKEKRKEQLKQKRAQEKEEKKAKKAAEAAKAAAEAAAARTFEKGCIVKLEGLGEGIKVDDVKQPLKELADCAFVDISGTTAMARFASAEEANKAVKALNENKKEFGGKVPVVSVLTGDEEQAYWNSYFEQREALKKKGQGRGKQGGKKDNKRKREDGDNNTANKDAKTTHAKEEEKKE